MAHAATPILTYIELAHARSVWLGVQVWGDDMLLALPELRAPFICTAMNYLEVFVLGCESLLKIAADFPISQKLIRKKTCRCVGTGVSTAAQALAHA